MAENQQEPNKPKRSIYEHAEADGHFRRKESQFRNWISSDPNAEFPAEKDRYVWFRAPLSKV
jgi:glutathionyl-hydroquinone reductase